MRKIKSYLSMLLISIIFCGCGNNNVSSLPQALVNMRIDLSNEYNYFKSSFQYLIFEKPDPQKEIYHVGYGGILVYIDMNQRYCAFEMACPYEQDSKVRVKPDGDGLALNAVCEKCGSTFNLDSGSGFVVKGPAKEGLRRCQARTSTSLGTTYLYISPWKY